MSRSFPLRSVLGACLAVVALLASSPALAQAIVPPLSPTGPYPVACSNLEQDFSRLPSGVPAEAYWRGIATQDAERYVDALLVSPANAHAYSFVAPPDGTLFARWAGRALSYVALTCYPTTTSNTRADYVLPGGRAIPRMQRGAEAPILPAGSTRLPVLLFSHGCGGSPVSGTYLDALLAFASWGFVTVAPFHGDFRYSVFGPDFGGSRALYLPVWDEFVAMQATRPLSLAAALDRLAGDTQWKERIDLGRAGAFGISQGGESIMLLGGAKLTYQLFTNEAKTVIRDDRVRAAVGYVPYFGLEGIPAFGDDQAGVDAVTLPYLALSGSDDPIAPIDTTRQAIERMAGVRGLVSLEGQSHDLDPASATDITTWALTFYAAWLANDSAAQGRLATMQSVEGGLDDRKRYYVGGAPTAPGELADVIEYYNASFDHYFVTAFPEEAAMLDEGVQVPGWKRTGFTFRAYTAGTGPGNDACRFFGTPGRGPNSHFYTISAWECEKVRSNPDWTYEALAFRAVAPLSTGCEALAVSVTRLYNNGMGGEANHRYLVDRTEIDRMVARGWTVEGIVFCTPP